MLPFLISAVLHLSALLFTFFTLCILCDEKLVPAVEVFIVQFQVPEEVAAVTLVAFGSAAPELFLNSVSAVAHTSDLSLSAILGSGMIAFGLIPALCVLYSSRHEMKLKLFPILRECGFYFVGLSVFLWAIQDGTITTNEALVALFVYVFYVGMVIFMYLRDLKQKRLSELYAKYPSVADIAKRNKISNEEEMKALSNSQQNGVLSDSMDLARRELDFDREANLNGREHDSLLSASNSPINHTNGMQAFSAEIEDIEEAVPASAASSSWHRFYEYITRIVAVPIRWIFHYTFPSLHPTDTFSALVPSQDHIATVVNHEAVPLWRACAVLFASIVCISLLASLIVAISESFVSNLGIGTATMGATLVALGSEIPDTISSLALARNGYHDGAIAGAIGSQVINISIGVGLPSLFVCMTGNGQLNIAKHEAESLWFLACLLLIVISSYSSLTIPISKIYHERFIPEFCTVSKSGATIQICVWVAVYLLFILLNEETATTNPNAAS